MATIAGRAAWAGWWVAAAPTGVTVPVSAARISAAGRSTRSCLIMGLLAVVGAQVGPGLRAAAAAHVPLIEHPDLPAAGPAPHLPRIRVGQGRPIVPVERA